MPVMNGTLSIELKMKRNKCNIASRSFYIDLRYSKAIAEAQEGLSIVFQHRWRMYPVWYDARKTPSLQRSCGGKVQYCDPKCQLLQWKKGHKKECWKVASKNTFTLPRADGPDVPLRALRQLDGFGKSDSDLVTASSIDSTVLSFSHPK
jgi:hypothetical protein